MNAIISRGDKTAHVQLPVGRKQLSGALSYLGANHIRWFPDDPTGKRAFSCKNGKTFIEYGSLDPNGVGYVYKLQADTFEKLDEWQWISKLEAIPVEVICIRVKDYIQTISFSKQAEEIQKKLFE